MQENNPLRTCGQEGCVKLAAGRKMFCNKHTRAKYLTANSAVPLAVARVRFWRRVDTAGDGCWVWRTRKDRSRYGKVLFMGKEWLAHRVSWILEKGPIPDGMRVLHRCDNPPCVNPAHLFLGTQADNVADCVRKGRRAVNPGVGMGRRKEMISEQVPSKGRIV